MATSDGIAAGPEHRQAGFRRLRVTRDRHAALHHDRRNIDRNRLGAHGAGKEQPGQKNNATDGNHGNESPGPGNIRRMTTRDN